MSDDEAVTVIGDPLARSYDYFKHLTTVSLITIGGVFGLLQGDGPKLKPVAIMVVMGILAASGAISMLMTSAIAATDLRGGDTARARRVILIVQRVATALLMFGLGIFIGAFSQVIK